MSGHFQPRGEARRTAMAKVINTATLTPTAIPIPEIEVPNPSVEFGSDDGVGYKWDQGNGPGYRFYDIPASIKKRCSMADRLSRLNAHGGTEKCEEAVVNGLRFLKKTQNKDGSWCDQRQVGMTGLALLAYLGHCETTMSEEFGETVFAAITYLCGQVHEKQGEARL